MKTAAATKKKKRKNFAFVRTQHSVRHGDVTFAQTINQQTWSWKYTLYFNKLCIVLFVQYILEKRVYPQQLLEKFHTFCGWKSFTSKFKQGLEIRTFQNNATYRMHSQKLRCVLRDTYFFPLKHGYVLNIYIFFFFLGLLFYCQIIGILIHQYSTRFKNRFK